MILGLNQPLIEKDTGSVPVSLRSADTCEMWFTYPLNLIDNS